MKKFTTVTLSYFDKVKFWTELEDPKYCFTIICCITNIFCRVLKGLIETNHQIDENK